ncbi:MAG: tetratricopeptide repeat protein [Proteobacteria bacterium]|nr:tetratricopeptide repeat protein [Pseudomonadota bacterium]
MNALTTFLWFHAGRWLESRDITALAESCYRNALEGDGGDAAEAGFRLSKRLLDRDRNKEAAAICEQALHKAPRHARLWCALGAARRKLAQLPAAREAYESAISCDAAYSQAWCNLGEWHLASGNPELALKKFDQALALEKDLLEALNNRAAALYELGRFKDAEEAARAAIEIHPRVASLHVNLGNVLLHSGKARQAVKSFRKALECDPACPEAHMNLAMMLGETHRYAEALAHIEHEIAVKGESAQRLASLALAQDSKGDIAAAEATCRKVIEMQPGNVSALITLAGCYGKRSDHRGANRLLEQALAANPQMPGIYSNIAFNVTYIPDITAEEAFNCHREWARRYELLAAERVFTHEPDRQPERPLRIGYVSGDFGTHPVGFLLRDVARYHDRSQFFIHCYSMMRGSDAITEVIRANTDSWIDGLLLSDDELAEQIHQDHIDILVDLSGHTAYNRLPSFALKPAPIQASWIGYFHSTGMETIDYFITDPFTTPADSGQLFSETPVCLPHSRFCYSPPDYAPAVHRRPDGTGNPVTFGCFNRVEKLVAPVIDAWSRILAAIPDSRLVLKSGHLDNTSICDGLRRRFKARGVDPKRLDLRGPSAHPDMLEQYGEIDLALDPFPFNGGMTTLEALWMGVPVLTLAGNGVVSRQTVAALANIGLADELAFPNIEAYVQGAVALAKNRPRLDELRLGLRPRMAASPLCQPEQFARDLEGLYRRMWQAYCEGRKLDSAIRG